MVPAAVLLPISSMESGISWVSTGSVLEIGLPSRTGFPDADREYAVSSTDNPSADPAFTEDFIELSDPISPGDTLTIDGIQDGQAEFPLFVATDGTSISTIPEPRQLPLLSSGALGLLALSRLRRR